jgi:hypothetical protein
MTMALAAQQVLVFLQATEVKELRNVALVISQA